MDTRINIDLDTKWSWVVAFGSCWVNFCIYGLWRSYGILYVGFMDRYGISHQSASQPFLYACAIYHLIGPVVGVLSYRYPLRSLQLIGVLLSASGIAMVKISTNFTMVIAGVGIIQGLGLGILRTLSNVVIQNFFYKYRAIATAISMSGGVFSSFFFPSLGSYLLQTTDIETSFLIFAFITFLATLGVIVQRAPRYETNSIDINVTLVNIEKPVDKTIEPTTEIQIECIKCPLHNNSIIKCELCKGNQFLLDANSTTNQYETTDSSTKQTIEEKKKPPSKRPEESALSNISYAFTKPMFYVISFTFVCYNIYLQVFLMTIVDMTKKYEISRDDVGIKLISLFSLADLIGRLSSGILLDKNYLSLKNVAIICELTLFCAFIGLPNLNDLVFIQIATFLIGLSIGILTILWPLLNVDYFGTDKLAILLGLNCFFSGLESLLRPLLIGFYLDDLKSYKFLYYNMAAFSAIVALLWLIEPLLYKKKK